MNAIPRSKVLNEMGAIFLSFLNRWLIRGIKDPLAINRRSILLVSADSVEALA